MHVLQTCKVVSVVIKIFSCSMYIHSLSAQKKNSGFLHLRGNHTGHAALYLHFQSKKKTVLRWTDTASAKWVSLRGKYPFLYLTKLSIYSEFLFFNKSSTTKTLHKLLVGQCWTWYIKTMQYRNTSNFSALFKYLIF